MPAKHRRTKARTSPGTAVGSGAWPLLQGYRPHLVLGQRVVPQKVGAGHAREAPANEGAHIAPNRQRLGGMVPSYKVTDHVWSWDCGPLHNIFHRARVPACS